MPLDLQQFEKLDTYASQVGEPASLPRGPHKVAWSFPSQDSTASPQEGVP